MCRQAQSMSGPAKRGEAEGAKKPVFQIFLQTAAGDQGHAPVVLRHRLLLAAAVHIPEHRAWQPVTGCGCSLSGRSRRRRRTRFLCRRQTQKTMDPSAAADGSIVFSSEKAETPFTATRWFSGALPGACRRAHRRAARGARDRNSGRRVRGAGLPFRNDL